MLAAGNAPPTTVTALGPSDINVHPSLQPHQQLGGAFSGRSLSDPPMAAPFGYPGSAGSSFNNESMSEVSEKTQRFQDAAFSLSLTSQPSAGDGQGQGQGSSVTWSSLDGIPRSTSVSSAPPAAVNWQPSPSDGILHSTQQGGTLLNGSTMHHSSSTGPTLPGSMHPGNGSMGGSLGLAGNGRAPFMPPANNGLHSSVGGLTPVQQQRLQQQLFLQQQQQQQQIQQKVAGSFGQGNVVQVAAQAAQAAHALRQQALLRQQQQSQNSLLLQQALLNGANAQRGYHMQQQQMLGAGMRPGSNSMGVAPGISQNPMSALLGSQNNTAFGGNAVSQALQSQQQQLLLAQALRGQQEQQHPALQRTPSQLQSEALIAMQQQQQGGLARPMMPPHGAAHLSPTDQLQAFAQIGLLNKSIPGLNSQQQAALLSALQTNVTGPMLRGVGPQQQQSFGPRAPQYPLTQAQRPPMGGVQLETNHQQNLLALALAQQQQQQQQQMFGLQEGLPRGPSSQSGFAGMTGGPVRPQVGGVNTGMGGMGSASLPGSRDQAADPIQTLQDIGRTLSQLGITVEAAVNAGLLGGLSASDVRIVAEAHRVDVETRNNVHVNRINAPSPFDPQGKMLQDAALPQQRAFFGHGMRSNETNGPSSAPNPSSPAGSVGGASVVSAPARPQAFGPGSQNGNSDETSIPDDDDAAVDALLADIEDASGPIERGGNRENTAVDEAAIKAKMEELAAQFDAAQYGFFGGNGVLPVGMKSRETPEELLAPLEGQNDDVKPANDGIRSLESFLPDDLNAKLDGIHVRGLEGTDPG